jgi:isoleucyl-tRNA synthetase
MPFKKVEPRINFPKTEESILDFWRQNKIFEKSISERSEEKPYSFYDGPPFATGLPHYGHLLAGTIKDVFPRYKTMQGYRVERIWGWDTHGLPIENIVEQELDIKTKLGIEEYGVDKFNEKCRSKVLKYAEEWKKTVERTGRWIDMKNAYLTMDQQYMESVWWAFTELWKKGLIYEGHKVMPYCPRCSTSLSNFEVGLGYADKTDQSITLKFEIIDEPGTYFLVWTTTPWTLPGNLALTVGKGIDYVVVQSGDQKYILAESRLEAYAAELGKYQILEKKKGKELLGLSYKPVFDYYEKIRGKSEGDESKAFVVIAGDFVSTEDGSGIVHTAPAFGEDDYNVCKANGIDFFMPVDDMGQFTIEVPDYAGQSVIRPETNEQIIKDLGETVFKVEPITHSYPHCYRCETPLIYRGVQSYFVAVEKLRTDLIQNNKDIHWMPEFVGRARYAKMLETAPDWNISRNRFWGTPIPVWKCEKCEQAQVFDSAASLEKASGLKVNDLHLHFTQKIELPCECGGRAKLSGEVLDCWFESGSMPYASIHYPFENEARFKREFPADFIAEGIDQTRGWFNSLLILSTALFGETSYKNVVVNGIVLAENGQKMSKRLNNYPDPAEVIDKYGADAMRFYLMGSPAVKAEDLRFSEKGVEEVVKKINLTLWNSYSFFVMYAALDGFVPRNKLDSQSLLDKWLVSLTNKLVKEVTGSFDKYDLATVGRLMTDYIDELSNWYIRRSRKRFWKSENDTDKNAAYETLYYALTTYLKLLAPFMPFLTDEIYRGLVLAVDSKAAESIHLSDWPNFDDNLIDEKLDKQMAQTRKIVEAGLAVRNANGIKVRQPLAKLMATSVVAKLPQDMTNIVLEEMNIKSLELTKGTELKVELDMVITPELKAEGIARDLIRFIQDGRKKADFNVEDRIITHWNVVDVKNAGIAKAIRDQADFIAKETLSTKFNEGELAGEYSETVKLDGHEVTISLNRNN